VPTDGVKKPKGDKAEMRLLVPDEIKLLAETIKPRFKALVYVGAYCGLRIGEMIALRRENLDLFRGELTVVATASEATGSLRIGPPKTKASLRSVEIPRPIVRELKAHLDAHVPAGEPYVFPALHGGPQLPNAFRGRFWKPAVKSAGLAPLRIHDLRHTAISLWLSWGDDPVTVARRAGHTSTVTVMDVYGHRIPKKIAESTKRGAEAFEQARTPRMGKVIQLR
jgi:integrase